MNFLGCLLIFIFGGIFFILALARQFFNLLFGGTRPASESRQSTTNSFTNSHRTHTGNAHREHSGGHPNSRQRRRSGKIFEKDEGKYIDFEEV